MRIENWELSIGQISFYLFAPLCLFLFVFTSFAQRSPGSANAIRQNNLGVGYMNQARIAEALQAFRRAEMQDPSLFGARLNEGIALLNLQRPAEARDVLLDATKRQPQSARAWYNLGLAYRTLAQGDAAVEAFERVSKLDPSDADTLCFFSVSFTRRPGVTIRPSRLSKSVSRWILSTCPPNSVWRTLTSFPETRPWRRDTSPGSTN